MAENYLITGYWGEPHVTPENDRGINAAIFGAGRFVLPVGEQFRAEYIGNNTVRIYDGKLVDNGAVAGIPAGEYVDLLIPVAGQDMKRNDLIIFRYSKDPSTLVEKGVFTVLSGKETSGTAVNPMVSQEDLLTNEATLDEMPLWRVSVSGAVISDPVKLFSVYENNVSHMEDKDNPHGVTASQVGAAPTGYGLGTGGVYCSSPDSVFNGGFYRWDVAKDSAPFANASMLVIPRAKDTTAGQIAFGHAGNSKGVLAMRAASSTSANEWDWVNPPMTIGNEYRTAERYNASPVYTRLVNFGTLPNKTTKAVTVLNSGVKVSKIIGISGYILHSGGSTHIELSAHPSVRQSMELSDTGMTLNLITDADMSAWSAVIQIKYI